MIEFGAKGIRLRFDAETGLLDGFTVEDEGHEITPLHRAPWVGTDEAMPPGTPPHLATLGGDFFCAPFAGSEEGSPLHGWTANSPWDVVEREATRLRARLQRTVCSAIVIKELEIEDGHPFVYQRHVFTGGSGRIAVSNHANVSLPQGGLISCSPKSAWETPPAPPEADSARGRSGLRYPGRSTMPERFPGVDGSVDLSRFPWSPRHEDVVIGVEAREHSLGWTAVTRPVECDLFLSLRNARRLPMTVFWHSNGGRDYPPWSGRHFGCLGVEESAAAALLSHSGEGDLSGPGALTLIRDGESEVRHAIGAIRWPSGERVKNVRMVDHAIEVCGDRGGFRRLAFRKHFLD
ncbi:hypothetical protein Rleg4DRAFT_4722 [Rhizobium leguminosarum bv. trifolii WSM2297]|uniref:Galactose mutarotase-like enzyme n=1 Tax=Rhizobium leguminosarum bv. trifolii WSM2297 TaxID=754762 RepID=J0KYU2_RHILT|nr:hypothetical protein [Rhizobium leguminosarum]EJC82984.1 hypothetical protein Rleg4DRAFT_4722 [Rhizobium leguminosarum bv. trifolii WSM2297]